MTVSADRVKQARFVIDAFLACGLNTSLHVFSRALDYVMVSLEVPNKVLAQSMGVSATTILRYRSGEVWPSVHLRAHVFEALKRYSEKIEQA